MKLPELLKRAVRTQDWQLICTAYTAMTGEFLLPPQPKTPDFDTFDIPIPDEELKEPDWPIEDEEEPEIDDGPTIDEEDGEQPEEELESSVIITDLDEAKAEIARANAKKKDRVIKRKKLSPREQGAEDGVRAKKEPIKIPSKRVNKFKDDVAKETDKSLLQTANPQLKKLYANKSHRLTRHDLVEEGEGVDTGLQREVVCSLCEKEEVVPVSVATGYSDDPDNNTYRCNSCSTPSGRAKVLRTKNASRFNEE
jgi:DNA-directed RNA polymerase subunit M/transcription elongation factor TFIIS